MNPLSNDQVFNLYIQLRPRNHEFERCIKSVTSILSTYPNASVFLAGLGKDAHQSHITFNLRVVNPSITSEEASSTLAFANAVFTQLFDYLPCYTTEPTEHEKLFALNFASSKSIPDQKSDLVEKDVFV